MKTKTKNLLIISLLDILSFFPATLDVSVEVKMSCSGHVKQRFTGCYYGNTETQPNIYIPSVE